VAKNSQQTNLGSESGQSKSLRRTLGELNGMTSTNEVHYSWWRERERERQEGFWMNHGTSIITPPKGKVLAYRI